MLVPLSLSHTHTNTHMGSCDVMRHSTCFDVHSLYSLGPGPCRWEPQNSQATYQPSASLRVLRGQYAAGG